METTLINNMIKKVEFVGTATGIIGAFLVAVKLGNFGYPFFLVSSLSLCYTAVKQGNKNLVALQGTFLAANVIGLFNYI